MHRTLAPVSVRTGFSPRLIARILLRNAISVITVGRSTAWFCLSDAGVARAGWGGKDGRMELVQFFTEAGRQRQRTADADAVMMPLMSRLFACCRGWIYGCLSR